MNILLRANDDRVLRCLNDVVAAAVAVFNSVILLLTASLLFVGGLSVMLFLDDLEESDDWRWLAMIRKMVEHLSL